MKLIARIYLPSTVVLSIDPCSGENVPLCICVGHIRVRDAVYCRMVSTQFADRSLVQNTVIHESQSPASALTDHIRFILACWDLSSLLGPLHVQIGCTEHIMTITRSDRKYFAGGVNPHDETY